MNADVETTSPEVSPKGEGPIITAPAKIRDAVEGITGLGHTPPASWTAAVLGRFWISCQNGLDFCMEAMTNEFSERIEPNFGAREDRYINRLVKATDDCIAHHPWGAVGFALAFGLIMGGILAGRGATGKNRCR